LYAFFPLSIELRAGGEKGEGGGPRERGRRPIGIWSHPKIVLKGGGRRKRKPIGEERKEEGGRKSKLIMLWAGPQEHRGKKKRKGEFIREGGVIDKVIPRSFTSLFAATEGKRKEKGKKRGERSRKKRKKKQRMIMKRYLSSAGSRSGKKTKKRKEEEKTLRKGRRGKKNCRSRLLHSLS